MLPTEGPVLTDTETISATEFKAKCLNILDRLASRELKRVTITKRGQPVAVLTPPDRPADAVCGIYGFMRGSVIVADDVDLADPALNEPFTSEDLAPASTLRKPPAAKASVDLAARDRPEHCPDGP